MHQPSHRSPRGPALAASLLALALPALASASTLPDPRFCTFPLCLGVCPKGDIAYTVIVRDVSAAPVRNATVVVQVGSGYGGGCANPVIDVCADCAELPGYDPVAKSFTRVSDVNGVATFHLCASLLCPGSTGRWAGLVANGVVLGTIAISDTDLNADGVVNAQDVALVTAATSSPFNSADDEDCNGVVDANDIAFVTAHVGHACAGVVPTLPSSWGSVKAVYR